MHPGLPSCQNNNWQVSRSISYIVLRILSLSHYSASISSTSHARALHHVSCPRNIDGMPCCQNAPASTVTQQTREKYTDPVRTNNHSCANKLASNQKFFRAQRPPRADAIKYVQLNEDQPGHCTDLSSPLKFH